MSVSISIPPGPAELLRRLNAAGFEAYVVGGCVRDSLRGVSPSDWDVCTSARPEQTAACFSSERVIPTGLAHGTVTVLLDGMGYEITTFRTEGGYTDHRHPDEVSFVDSITADLARRDFTVNAMAYHPEKGLCDPFGGREDLSRRRIRCVGEPDRRFEEDALRILRALRFASQLDFVLDDATASSALRLASTLAVLPGERVAAELKKLLCGRAAGRVLLEYWPVLCAVIPELAPLQGAPQDNPHHRYSMDRHTAEAVAAAPPVPALRLCMLFHDVAKPLCRTTDAQGVGHYKGHPARSAEIAERTLRRLRFDRALIDRACLLIRYHDDRFPPDPSSVKSMLRLLGADLFGDLLQVQRADTLAKGDGLGAKEALERISSARAAADEIIRRQECYSLSQLAVRGGDLIRLGVPPGPEVGRRLNELLDRVIGGSLPNEREALLGQIACPVQTTDSEGETK